MNLIKFLRKPHLAIFLSMIILFVSCSQYDNDLNDSSQISANDLKRIHNDIKFGLSKEKFSFKTSEGISTAEQAEAERVYLENVEYLNDYGLEALFDKSNVNIDFIPALNYFFANENNEDIYQELIDEFKIVDERDASILFTIIEIKQIIEIELANSTSKSMSSLELQKISWGCALAIASTVGVTIGLLTSVPITGGASLVSFLVWKGVATAALIEACGDGWGDI